MTRLILLSFCLFLSVFISAQGEFITKWNIETDGELLTIPIQSGYTYDYVVDWGDGSDLQDFDGDAKHVYQQAGHYEVKISGAFPSIYLNNEGDKDKLLEIVQWGDIKWESMKNASYGASKMTIVEPARSYDGRPNFGLVRDLTNVLRGCTSILENDVFYWDVSKVEIMDGVFEASSFDGSLPNWHVGSVKSMRNMFKDATNFTGETGSGGIRSWNVSNVEDMASMFKGATSFNSSLSNWDVSSVSTMANMFSGATLFNGYIGNWNVKNVDSMIGMFGNAESFNQDLNNWNVSNVNNMFAMFKGAKVFNKSLKDWNVSSVVNMSFMFNEAEAYNQDISKWEIANVAQMIDFLKDSNMSPNFYDKALMSWFSQPIQNGVTLGVGDITFCFSSVERALLVSNYGWDITDGGKSCYDPSALVLVYETIFVNQTVVIFCKTPNSTFSIDWESDGVIDTVNASEYVTHEYPTPGRYAVSITGDFSAPHVFSGDALAEIAQWGEIKFSDLSRSFFYNSRLQVTALDAPNISDIGAGVSMDSMFFNCSNLNADINHWDVSNVTNMSNMFSGATNFNHDLIDWDVSNVSDMNHMFYNATSFNHDLNEWDVINVGDMSYMFSGASSFKQDLNGWDVINVNNMRNMFEEARSFNGNISSWEVSNVTNMSEMFADADQFNQDIGGWTVSSVTDMSGMLSGTLNFNHSISNWDVTKVISFESMFSGAREFNQSLDGWSTTAATDMSNMFKYASSFNRPLNHFKTESVTNMRGMFYIASAFNQPLTNFKVGNVDTMRFMFYRAISFDQDLGGWDVTKVSDMERMLFRAGLSRSTYDSTLIGWANNGQALHQNVKLGATGLTYCDGLTAHNALRLLGWDITGDALDCTTSSCTEARFNNYIGPDGGDWHDSDNWARGFIPDECDQVLIGLDKSVSLSADAQCFTIDVFPGSSLTIDGHELTVTAMIDNGN